MINTIHHYHHLHQHYYHYKYVDCNDDCHDAAAGDEGRLYNYVVDDKQKLISMIMIIIMTMMISILRMVIVIML
jgi:hypothetical protein